MLKMKAGKYLAVALKTAIGSCIAILAAEQFHLEFASSAGIIALLTLINTRWDTLRLSGVRLVSLFFCCRASGLDDLQPYEPGMDHIWCVCIFTGGDQSFCGVAEYHVCQCSHRDTFLDHP